LAEVKELRADVQNMPTPKNGEPGKPGVSPAPESIAELVLAQLPEIKDGEPGKDADIEAVIKEVLAQIPTPKDGKPGRDAQPPLLADVAALVLAQIPKPKDGVSPDPKAVAVAAAKQGKPGKNGASITDVRLERNILSVWIDGVKKKVGKIDPPAQPAFAQGGNTVVRPEIPPTADNVVIVNKLTDIITAAETRVTFKANTEYRFGAITTIESPYEADFEDGAVLTGSSQLFEAYRYTGTGTAFNGTGVSFEMRHFGFSVPNGTVFDVSNALPAIFNFRRCVECDQIGTREGGGGLSAVNLFDSVFLNVKTQGLKTPGDFLIISIREVFLTTQSTGVTLIDWTNSALNDLEITNLEAQAPAGSFVLDGDAGSVNVNAGRVATIRDSSLSTNALGNALGPGLSPDDAGYQYSNSIVIDSKVIGHCYVTMPATTGISSGVEVPIAGTFSEGGEASQTTCAANGFITTQNRIEKRGIISVDLDVDKVGGGQDDYVFRAKKIPIDTGVAVDVDGVLSTITLSGGGSDAISISGPVRFKEGDQFYISVEGSTNDDIDAVTTGLKVTE
jgi:hypothetical protein